jgi:hypothetical protein
LSLARKSRRWGLSLGVELGRGRWRVGRRQWWWGEAAEAAGKRVEH